MPNKRPIPLKDEPLDPLDELQELLAANLAAANALNKTISGYADTQPVTPEKIATAVKNAVRELLEERQRRFEREEQQDRAQGKLTPQECYARLSADYDDVLEKCRLVGDAYMQAGKVIDHLNRTRENYNAHVRGVNDRLDALIAERDMRAAGAAKPPFPARPKGFRALPAFVFRDVPLYCLRRVYRSRSVRRFAVVCLICLWLLGIGTACFIARDNAVLRKVVMEYRQLQNGMENTYPGNGSK